MADAELLEVAVEVSPVLPAVIGLDQQNWEWEMFPRFLEGRDRIVVGLAQSDRRRRPSGIDVVERELVAALAIHPHVLQIGLHELTGSVRHDPLRHRSVPREPALRRSDEAFPAI